MLRFWDFEVEHDLDACIARCPDGACEPRELLSSRVARSRRLISARIPFPGGHGLA